MLTQSTEHHRWLAQIAGEWACDIACDMGSDESKGQSTFRETVRTLGDLWVVGEAEGEVPDGQGGTMRMKSVVTLGYDPAQGRYIGNFITNCMAHQFQYNGTRQGNILTLDTKGPDMADPTKLVDYQDIVEIINPDKRLLCSQMKTDDGIWFEFMRATYTRV